MQQRRTPDICQEIGETKESIHARDKDRNEKDLLSKIIEKMIIIEDVRKEILETEASEAG